MIKVRVLVNGEWKVARVPLYMFLYGKFWMTFSRKFKEGTKIDDIRIIWPWEYKYLR